MYWTHIHHPLLLYSLLRDVAALHCAAGIKTVECHVQMRRHVGTTPHGQLRSKLALLLVLLLELTTQAGASRHPTAPSTAAAACHQYIKSRRIPLRQPLTVYRFRLQLATACCTSKSLTTPRSAATASACLPWGTAYTSCTLERFAGTPLASSGGCSKSWMLRDGGMTPLLCRITLLMCAEVMPAAMQRGQEQCVTCRHVLASRRE